MCVCAFVYVCVCVCVCVGQCSGGGAFLIISLPTFIRISINCCNSLTIRYAHYQDDVVEDSQSQSAGAGGVGAGIASLWSGAANAITRLRSPSRN